MNNIEHIIVEENQERVYGKTYIDGVYFGDWLRYLKVGNKPNREYLAETERLRQESVNLYWSNKTYTPSKEYYEVIKKWPVKQKEET